MSQLRPCRAVLWILCVLLILPGCRSKERAASKTEKQTTAADTSAPSTQPTEGTTEKTAPTPTDKAESKPFKLGDLIEPFTPPPLAELDKSAGWINSPVL